MVGTTIRRLRWAWVSACALSMLAFMSGPAQAQLATGTISGIVADDSGGTMPGVTITAVNLATGATRTVTTSESGRYQLSALSPGRYSVTAELQGFATIVRPDVTVNVGSVVDIDFAMQVAALQETVTVTGAAPLIESTRTDLSNVVTQQEIESLPSKQRQYLDFALLLPATVENVSTVQGTGAVIGGARSKEGTLLVDGFYNLDEGFTMPKQRHSQDTIQEFQLVTFGGAAEYGRAIGGVINAVTKSGSNSLDGSAYGFFRNTAMNAQAWEEKLRGAPKSDYDRQQWGGSLGGPLVQNKSFFFGAYERLREDWPFDNGITAANAAAIGLPPADAGTVPRYFDSHFAFGKWDHNLSQGQRLQASFSFTRFEDHQMCCLQPRATRSNPYQLFADDYAYLANWTNVRPSGRLLHEVKASYFPRTYGTRGLSEGGPPLVPEGQVNSGLLSNASPPQVSIASVATFGSVSLNNRIRTYPVQAIYTSSIFSDRHTVKFGADYMYAHYDYNQYNPLRGAYSFSSLANFQRGVYSTYSQSFGAVDNPRTHQYISGFVQDSWQLTSRLTMNYGIRYDVELNPEQKASGVPWGNDYNNVGPRFALSFDATGKGRTFLKLTSGVYYDRIWNNATNNLYALKGHETRETATWTPTSPGAPVYPNVFAERPPNLPPSVRDAIIMPSTVHVPTSAQVIGTLEHELRRDLAVSTSVVYTESWFKEYTLDTNLVFDAARNAFVRPDATYRRITQVQYDGPADYVGLLMDVTKRASRYGLNGSITVSRARQVPTGSPNDPRLGIDADFGPVPDNPTVRGVVSGWLNVIPSLQVSGSFSGRSGMAVNPVAAGIDLNGDGVFGDRTPTLGPFSQRAPGNNLLDLRLTWSVGDASRRKLSLFLESFNVLNSQRVRTVDNNYGATPAAPLASWLVPTSYFPPRELQLGARLVF